MSLSLPLSSISPSLCNIHPAPTTHNQIQHFSNIFASPLSFPCNRCLPKWRHIRGAQSYVKTCGPIEGKERILTWYWIPTLHQKSMFVFMLHHRWFAKNRYFDHFFLPLFCLQFLTSAQPQLNGQKLLSKNNDTPAIPRFIITNTMILKTWLQSSP